MAEYIWDDDEHAKVTLGQPYIFTRECYEYCQARQAPIAVIYYDTKTSAQSKELYSTAFSSAENVEAFRDKLRDYCCVLVLDRRGMISDPDGDQQFFKDEILKQSSLPFAILAVCYGGKSRCHQLPAVASVSQLAGAIREKCENGEGEVGQFSKWPGRDWWIRHQGETA